MGYLSWGAGRENPDIYEKPITDPEEQEYVQSINKNKIVVKLAIFERS